ncbi:transcriptional regulator [Methanosarcinales archaeon]|nr:MAG: transcriptional regulator [Methanosarcinales archaeon]
MEVKIDCLELNNVIDRGEDTSNQFKANFHSVDKLAVEICAFANSDGGSLYIGISDSEDIEGLSKEDVNRLNQWISSTCSSKIAPPLFVKTEILICDGKRILVVYVPKGSDKPYAVNTTEFWVKSGADKRRATREELLRLMQSSGFLFADEIETGAGVTDFDADYFKRFYEQYYTEKVEDIDIPLEKLLENLKLVKNGQLTLAGLLLFGRSPERVKPQFVIKATYYKGNDIHSDEYNDSETIEGRLIEQFEYGVSFIQRNIKGLQKSRNINAPPILEIPKEAFMEAVANAIVHRDYFINAPIFINVFKNRLEIISPGILPNTITEDNIRYGVHIERNPAILSFLERDKKFRYSGRGSGVPRMIWLCRESDVKLDMVNDRNKQIFKVVFHRIPDED